MRSNVEVGCKDVSMILVIGQSPFTISPRAPEAFRDLAADGIAPNYTSHEQRRAEYVRWRPSGSSQNCFVLLPMSHFWGRRLQSVDTIFPELARVHYFVLGRRLTILSNDKAFRV